MTEDFIYIEQPWGSLFYKHIGQETKTEARRKCSEYGDSVHLPIPRFEDENTFYREHFGVDSLWLDIQKVKDFGFVDYYNHPYIRHINTVTVVETVNKHSWIRFNNSNYTDIIMTETGQWETLEDQVVDSVCVYNIIPENCRKCPDEAFCRYSDAEKTNTECVCPVGRGGQYCEEDLCSNCLNGGICRKVGEELECVCPRPFFGINCKLSNERVLLLSSPNIYKENLPPRPPMILDLFGKTFINKFSIFLMTREV